MVIGYPSELGAETGPGATGGVRTGFPPTFWEGPTPVLGQQARVGLIGEMVPPVAVGGVPAAPGPGAPGPGPESLGPESFGPGAPGPGAPGPGAPGPGAPGPGAPGPGLTAAESFLPWLRLLSMGPKLARDLFVPSAPSHARSPEVEAAWQAQRAGEFAPELQPLLARGYSPAQARLIMDALGPLPEGLSEEEIRLAAEAVLDPAMHGAAAGLTPADLAIAAEAEHGAIGAGAGAGAGAAGEAAPLVSGAAAGLLGAGLGALGPLLGQLNIHPALSPAVTLATSMLMGALTLNPITVLPAALGMVLMGALTPRKSGYVRHREAAARTAQWLVPWKLTGALAARTPEELARALAPWDRDYIQFDPDRYFQGGYELSRHWGELNDRLNQIVDVKRRLFDALATGTPEEQATARQILEQQYETGRAKLEELVPARPLATEVGVGMLPGDPRPQLLAEIEASLDPWTRRLPIDVVLPQFGWREDPHLGGWLPPGYTIETRQGEAGPEVVGIMAEGQAGPGPEFWDMSTASA